MCTLTDAERIKEMKIIQLKTFPSICVSFFLAFLVAGCGGGGGGGDSAPTPQVPGKTIGGVGNESGSSAEQTADGGYIITGYTTSMGAGGADVYLLKADAVGTMLWQKTFGSSGDDYGKSVRPTADGGYIIAGFTGSPGVVPTDVLMIKTDATGNRVWTKTFGGIGDDIASGVRQTSDGGYIVVGTCPGGVGEVNPEPDAFLLKTDAEGNFLWQQNFGNAQPNYWAEGYAVEVTADGFILTGKAEGQGFELYLVKTDASGNLLWEKTFSASGQQQGNAVIPTVDGGFVIVGESEVAAAGGGSSADVYLLKTNSMGEMAWEKTFGTASLDAGNEVRQTADGGYILTGFYGTRNGDAYLVKTNATGDAQWTKTFGGNGNDVGSSVRQTADGGFVIVGGTTSAGAGGSDVYFIKTDAAGNVE